MQLPPSGTGTLVPQTGHSPAAAAALIAVVAITAVAITVALTRKRITCHTWLDMPIGLTLPQPRGTGTTYEIHLGHAVHGPAGPNPAGAAQGWLVMLAITNPGCAAVRGSDFSAPLAFTFPGREIQATQIRLKPAARSHRRAPVVPALHVPPGSCPERGDVSSQPARMQLSGDLLLRPGDLYTALVLLSGTPTDDSRRIQQEGSLTSGKITAGTGREPGRAGHRTSRRITEATGSH